MYGLDLDQVLAFENNDLATLSYRDTITQQTGILVGLTKGSVPEFPQDGITPIAGNNRNAVQYPVILRQQAAVFAKDDRYKSISVSSFTVDVESIIIDLQITTKLNDVLNEQLQQ